MQNSPSPNDILQHARTAAAEETAPKPYTPFRLFGLFGAPLIALLMLLLPPPEGLSPQGWQVAALAVLMILWWVSEAVPVAVTALLPLILLPLFDIAKLGEISGSYASDSVFVFMGGFLLAIAMEKWHLHRRIALNILKRVGTRANAVIGGFLFACWSLSMWMSNTATAMMMLPIGMSVILLLREHRQGTGAGNEEGFRRFGLSLMLAIAFGASIGGFATLVGTPPNMVFKAYVEKTYGITLGFLDWMLYALPVSLLMLAACWLLLTQLLWRNGLGRIEGVEALVQSELHSIGAMSAEEKRVAFGFLLTVALWLGGKPLMQSLGLPKVDDAAIAIFGGLLMFLLPSRSRPGEGLLVWKDTEKMAWGILLLFGGGTALADAMGQTGLTGYIADRMSDFEGLPPWLTILAVILFFTAITEMMGNLTVVTAFLPMVVVVAEVSGIHPFLLMMPATIAASLAFMLPISTPPNAIVYASGQITVAQMAKTGVTLNILGAVILLLSALYLLPLVFDTSASLAPLR